MGKTSLWVDRHGRLWRLGITGCWEWYDKKHHCWRPVPPWPDWLTTEVQHAALDPRHRTNGVVQPPQHERSRTRQRDL